MVKADFFSVTPLAFRDSFQAVARGSVINESTERVGYSSN